MIHDFVGPLISTAGGPLVPGLAVGRGLVECCRVLRRREPRGQLGLRIRSHASIKKPGVKQPSRGPVQASEQSGHGYSLPGRVLGYGRGAYALARRKSSPKAQPMAYQCSLRALPKPEPICSWMAMWKRPTCSSIRDLSRGPTSMGLIPPDSTSEATLDLASAESPAISTSRVSPATSPETRVLAKVVLKALTTAVPPGTSLAVSSPEELPSGVTTRSKDDQSSGLVMSMTTLPLRPSLCSSMAAAICS